MTEPFDNTSGRPEDWQAQMNRRYEEQIMADMARQAMVPPSQHLLLPQEMQPSVGLIPTEFFSTLERVVFMVTCLLTSAAALTFLYFMVRAAMLLADIQERLNNWNNLLN